MVNHPNRNHKPTSEAPELLAALKALLHDYEYNHLNPADAAGVRRKILPSTNVAVAQARSVIAKAKGDKQP